MTKLLVVDDEVDLEMLIKQKFRRQIRERKYEFIYAINGNEALEKLEQHPDVDVMLSDINMPGMDGLTLLTKLKEMNTLNEISYCISIWRYGEHSHSNESWCF